MTDHKLTDCLQYLYLDCMNHNDDDNNNYYYLDITVPIPAVIFLQHCTTLTLCSDRLRRPQAADDVLDQAHGHGSDGWLPVERQDMASRLPRYVVAG